MSHNLLTRGFLGLNYISLPPTKREKIDFWMCTANDLCLQVTTTFFTRYNSHMKYDGQENILPCLLLSDGGQGFSGDEEL